MAQRTFPTTLKERRKTAIFEHQFFFQGERIIRLAGKIESSKGTGTSDFFLSDDSNDKFYLPDDSILAGQPLALLVNSDGSFFDFIGDKRAMVNDGGTLSVENYDGAADFSINATGSSIDFVVDGDGFKVQVDLQGSPTFPVYVDINLDMHGYIAKNLFVSYGKLQVVS